MSTLFDPITLRGITARNRIAVSPMCQYSSEDGFASDWHLVHLGSRAVGGAGIVLTEAIAVTADGRISPQDLGIWKDEHVDMLARIVRFIEAQGARAGTQLAHAGRKASTFRPWADESGWVPPDRGGWTPVAPSAIAFDPTYGVPHEMSVEEIRATVQAFADGAKRSEAAGFTVVELHAAHGYLAHQFLSPLSNARTDAYGGSFENRIRFLLESVDAVRAVWPERYPLFVRISATDWAEGGWDLPQSVELARILKTRGVDLIDVSSGGLVPHARIPIGRLYQVPLAEELRREAGIATGAVGLITTSAEAESIVATGKADLVFLARELLRDPYFPLHAAHHLGVEVPWPRQYERAHPQLLARTLDAAKPA